MAVSFIGGENHRPATSHWQTLLHNVVSSTPHLSGIRTHNVSGNMHWLHTAIGSCKLYDHDHNGPQSNRKRYRLTALMKF